MRLAAYAHCAPACRIVARTLRMIMLGVVIAALNGNADTAVAVAPPVTTGRLRVELERVVNRPLSSSLSIPTVGLAFAPDDSGRMFLLEKGGTGSFPGPARIRVLQNGTYSTMLDLTSEVSFGNENGLLGMAFHPGFADPISPGYRKLYTYHSVPVDAGAVVDFNSSPFTEYHNLVTEWQVMADNPNEVDVSTRREVFREAHYIQHNGGTIEFGPDGYLYGAIGNPGGSTAKYLASQDKSNLLGKVFRIDPLDPSLTPSSPNATSANGKYRVPADNPFVSDPAALDEIYATGFRNPFRFSVDPVSGKAFVGDVGQGATEEVDVVTSGGNYGWPYREGNGTGVISLPNPAPTLVAPIAEYPNPAGSVGAAVIGGYVYRGSIPALQGKYIFGDFSTSFFNGTGKLFFSEPFDAEGNLKDPANIRVQQILTAPATCAQTLNASVGCSFDSALLSFGVDHDGELYALGSSSNKAVVYKFTDAYILPEGDYNEDGVVDAADYTVWRDTLGKTVTAGSNANGGGSGIVDLNDYEIWRQHFGESIALGSGGGGNAQLAVPELSCVMLTLEIIGLIASAHRWRRSA